jgi:nucleoid-associated protein YgaU
MGLRYGLLAVLTLVIASALAWDRLHPPETNRLFPRDEPSRSDLAVVVLGGRPEPPPPPPASTAAPSATGTSPPPGAGEEPDGTYRVEAGDSLGQIALKTMGSSRKAGELAKFNGISVDAPLKVGQEIRIPPAAPAGPVPGTGAGTASASARAPAAPAPAAPAKGADRTCRVGKGDTLFGLARKYYGDGGRYRDLAEANGLDPDQPLRVGTELKLP